jgi:hypothetical protein
MSRSVQTCRLTKKNNMGHTRVDSQRGIMIRWPESQYQKKEQPFVAPMPHSGHYPQCNNREGWPLKAHPKTLKSDRLEAGPTRVLG